MTPNPIAQVLLTRDLSKSIRALRKLMREQQPAASKGDRP